MPILSAAKPVHKPSEIAYADYEIHLFTQNPTELLAAIEQSLAKPALLVQKKAKQGRRKIEKEIDIKPNISEFHAQAEEACVALALRLTAGDCNNINPALLLEALCRDFSGEIQNTDILKKRLLLENGEPFC